MRTSFFVLLRLISEHILTVLQSLLLGLAASPDISAKKV
jgi:hypothetical protein